MEPHTPTAAALSRPILALLLVSFVLNAGSGLGLWLWPTHAWRVFHGWTLPPFLITLGVVWRFHVLRGWNLKKNRVSGAWILAVFLVLTATGWLLYYAGTDELQKRAGSWHAGLGLTAGLLFPAHALLGLKSRAPDVANSA